MNDYKPNSHRFKEEQNEPVREKKVEKVVHGVVKTKKRSEMNKLADVFISEDVKNVKSYVLMEVLVPAIKKAISDIVTNGIDMILYGETSRSNRKNYAGGVSYRNYYDQRNDHRPSETTRTRYDYADVTVESWAEADEVLTRMTELIELYGMVSVADFYDLVGITCNYTDNKYGWKHLRNAEAVRVRDGYKFKLPKVVPLD